MAAIDTQDTALLSSSRHQPSDYSTVDAGGKSTAASVSDVGPWAACATLFGCFCSFFASMAMFNSIGVYYSYLEQHQLRALPSSHIGSIFGFYSFFSFFVGVALGPTLDFGGPRLLTLVGAALLLAMYALLGYCRTYWHFFVAIGLLGSVSTSMLFTSAMTTVQQCFHSRRGLAMGLTLSGGSVGGIVSPLVLGALLPKIGFAWATRAMGLILVPFMIVSMIFVRNRAPKDSDTANNAHDAANSALDAANSALDASPKGFVSRFRFPLTPGIIVLTIGIFFVEVAMIVPLAYITSYAYAHGMSAETAYQMTMLLNIGSMLGRWLPGWAGDQYGYFNTQIVALALCITTILAVWIPLGNQVSGLISFALLFGLGTGSGVSLVPVCIAQLCDRHFYGRTLTFIFSVGSFGSLVGIPLAGKLVRGDDYLGLQLFAAASYVLAFASFVAVRVMSIGLGGFGRIQKF